MKSLGSYVCDAWHRTDTDTTELVDPTTEEPLARASTAGVDFGAVVTHARRVGGPSLRGMTFAERGGLLKRMSKALYAARDELLEISMRNGGTTRRDAKFDVDGATGTLAYYAALGADLGDARRLVDGDGEALGRSARFWGQHVRVPKLGVAVHINAFNFPAWGFAEKAAATILAGMPVVTKPATSTAMLTERCIEILVEADAIPPGVLQLVCGSTGDLLKHLDGQDVLAFTGSASTGTRLRGLSNLVESSAAVNLEADSLNAAVLGRDVEPGSETWSLFVSDVVREMTQKTGQKCTAVRRIFVPDHRIDDVTEGLREELSRVRPGSPFADEATMGPLSTAQQLDDVTRGIEHLARWTRPVLGDGERVDGIGAPAGKGYFVSPALLVAEDVHGAGDVHVLEVFGPCATVLPCRSIDEAAAGVALGGGCLVTSLYSDDDDEVERFMTVAGATTGRLYLGSEKAAGQAPGSGIALPQSLHGGPGRAGGGEELGGVRALELYTQRVALQGNRRTLEKLAGLRET